MHTCAAHKGTEVQSCVVQLANLQESVGPLMASLEQQNIHCILKSALEPSIHCNYIHIAGYYLNTLTLLKSIRDRKLELMIIIMRGDPKKFVEYFSDGVVPDGSQV